MTQEEKQLLLKDLCARLPYEVIVDVSRVEEWKQLTLTPFILSNYYDDIEKIKPYLRPLSSMTEEEREEFRTLILPEASCAYEDCLEWDAQIIGGGYLQISVEDFSKVVDWLNAHHFDYRIDPSTGKTLIESGLALEAPVGMYETE